MNRAVGLLKAQERAGIVAIALIRVFFEVIRLIGEEFKRKCRIESHGIRKCNCVFKGLS